MTFSCNVHEFGMRSSQNVEYNLHWLDLDDSRPESSKSGIYITLFFDSVETVDKMIAHLETLKKEWR